MKINLKASLLRSIFFIAQNISVHAQTNNLPEIKLPELDYKPVLKTGWVGQYVYELHFWDSVYYKSGKYEKRLWVRTDQTKSGYIEFPREVRGAIRSNHPDKNNTTRYESWIRSGTSYAWSKINDTIKTTEPIGVMGEITVTGKAEITRAYNSKGEWVKGRLNGADMQIDHSTKKYSLAPPEVSFEMEGTEWGQETYFNPAKKVPLSRSIKYNGSPVSLKEMPEFFEGDFEEGQKEIIIRKRMPVSINMEVSVGVSSKLLTKKGYIDFYLVLKRVPLEGDDKSNKSVSTNTTPVTEQEPEKMDEQNNAPEKNTKKKRGLGGLRNKVNGIIGKNL